MLLQRTGAPTPAPNGSTPTPTPAAVALPLDEAGRLATELVANARRALATTPVTDARTREALEALLFHARSCVHEATCAALRQS